MTQPAAVPDPLDNIEPTAEEIAAAAEDERRDADRSQRAAKKTTAAKRGPGRPPGAKNKTATETAAREAGKTTAVAPKKPPVSGAAAASQRDAAARRRAERKATVDSWVNEAMGYRLQLVGGVGLATGIPANFLVGVVTDEAGRPLDEAGKPVKTDPQGNPLPGEPVATALTHYGEALAPAPWQIKIGCEAAVRLADSDEGERLLELWEKHAVKVYGVAALGAVVVYTITTLQAVNAIKPLVKMELDQQMAAQAEAAARAAEGETPGGASAGPTG